MGAILDQALADHASEDWVIIKRDLFYRPGSQGYTGIRDHAGRYTEAEAKAAAEMDGVSCMRLADAPEYTRACFHDLKFDHMQAKLTATIEAKDAEIARLKAFAVDAGNKFAFYAENHRAKGTVDGLEKAATNQLWADTARALAGGQRPDKSEAYARELADAVKRGEAMIVGEG